MSNMIEVLAEELREVSQIIESRTKAEKVTFNDALTLVYFVNEYEDTSEFVDETEERVRDNAGALLVCMSRLQGLIRHLLSLDMSVWNKVDFASLEQKNTCLHIKPDGTQQRKSQPRCGRNISQKATNLTGQTLIRKTIEYWTCSVSEQG